LECGGQGADFVVAMDVNVLVEVARVADFLGDCDEVLQRLRDGLGGAYGFKESKADGKQGAKNDDAKTALLAVDAADSDCASALLMSVFA